VQSAQFGMKPLADNLAISHHDRTHERIRTDSTAPALSKLKRSSQMTLIRGCDLAAHRTD
jgi:hypothetical protein